MKRFATVVLVLGCLGSATDAYAVEAPPSSSPSSPALGPPSTVSVEGVASVAISQTASQAEADAAYRQGLAAAIGDGHGKAEFLAAETGAKVGSIQQISERGGSIECILHAEAGPLADNEEYIGAVPDFGSVESSGSPFAVTHPEAPRSVVATKTSHPRPKKRRVKAKKAAEPVSCALSTRVLLSYLLIAA
jgi:hypothetical protein